VLAPRLTAGQARLLSLVARGLPTKQIAAELGVSDRAITARLSRLFRAYQTSNRAGLIAAVLSQAGVGLEALERPGWPGGGAQPDVAETTDAYANAPFMVSVTRGPDHVYTFVNAVSARVAGRDDLVGKAVDQVLLGDVRVGSASEARQLLKRDEHAEALAGDIQRVVALGVPLLRRLARGARVMKVPWVFVASTTLSVGIAVRSGVAGLTFASAGLGSEIVKISKPVVRAMSAAVYQLLPSAIQSPGAASFIFETVIAPVPGSVAECS